MLRLVVATLVLLLLGLALLGAYWLLRPNRARVDSDVVLESWDVVRDRAHNSNTDLVFWREAFHLVHASSPYHMGTPRSKLVVRRSPDGRSWQTLAELRMPGRDIRDPKFAAVGERLFLYALSNEGFFATPNATWLATSDDGVHWSAFEPLEPRGWLFWRPKTRDGAEWYVAAYWHEHGRSALLRSLDGRHWDLVSEIHGGEGNDETAIEFLPDGRLLATARLEVTPDRIRGNNAASTLLAVAKPPYERWTYHRSQVTRLDGPVLFSYRGRVYAVGRFQPGRRGPLTQLGGVLSRKRTSLFRVEENRLIHLTDLPSAGDTSYAGVVVRGEDVYADYYTSHVGRDYPWLVGMFLPTDIRMARISLPGLLALAQERAAPR